MKKTTKRHVLIYIFYPSFRCFPPKKLEASRFSPTDALLGVDYDRFL